jgi:hypothetical protein
VARPGRKAKVGVVSSEHNLEPPGREGRLAGLSFQVTFEGQKDHTRIQEFTKEHEPGKATNHAIRFNSASELYPKEAESSLRHA